LKISSQFAASQPKPRRRLISTILGVSKSTRLC